MFLSSIVSFYMLCVSPGCDEILSSFAVDIPIHFPKPLTMYAAINIDLFCCSYQWKLQQSHLRIKITLNTGREEFHLETRGTTPHHLIRFIKVANSFAMLPLLTMRFLSNLGFISINFLLSWSKFPPAYPLIKYYPHMRLHSRSGRRLFWLIVIAVHVQSNLKTCAQYFLLHIFLDVVFSIWNLSPKCCFLVWLPQNNAIRYHRTGGRA